MQTNLGTIDRVLRIVLGLVLIYYATLMPDTGYNVYGWVGVIPLGTALFGMCPIYAIFGLKTCSSCAEKDATPEA